LKSKVDPEYFNIVNRKLIRLTPLGFLQKLSLTVLSDINHLDSRWKI